MFVLDADKEFDKEFLEEKLYNFKPSKNIFNYIII